MLCVAIRISFYNHIDLIIIQSFWSIVKYFQNSLPHPRLGILYPTIDRFFSIYNDVVRYSAIVESVDAGHYSDHDTTTTGQSKSSFLWVEADLITDLDIVSLLNNQNDVPLTALPRSLSKRPSLG
jgi:hypothetical protein